MQKPGRVARWLTFGLAGWVIAGSLALPSRVHAQAVGGTILGDVRDASGAGIAGATVALVHSGTGFTRTLVTDARGQYIAPLLPTGDYRVSAALQGFKVAVAEGVHLGVDRKVRVELRLSVLEREETIEVVQSDTPLLQTSSSDLGTTVESQLIAALPLNGRNFVSLTRTVPGVQRGVPGVNIDGAGTLAWRASGSFSANGQRPRDNNFLLDGVDNNESWLQSVVVFPSVDALDEFKLQTSTYSAEFGKSLGGVVSLQLKSGSNERHASAFGFLRDDALDANNFFNNRAGVPRAPFRQYQFGATLSGPIRTDRTFLFASYQGLLGDQGVNRLSTVPSWSMREGDFSEIQRTIFDPLTGQPFPGKVVPRARWDAASANILDRLIPLPNAEGQLAANGQTINNYVDNPNQERRDNQLDVKLDHNLSASNRFFVRYSLQKSERFLPAAFPEGDGFGNQDSTIETQSLVFSDTHSFGAGWLNELRVGWSSFALRSGPRDPTDLAAQMGIPNVNVNEYTQGMSTIAFNQNGIRAGGQPAFPGAALGTAPPAVLDLGTLQIGNDVTHVRGRHALKAGGSVVLRSREILSADNLLGSFFFNQSSTSNCAGRTSGCTLDPSSGFDVASFLLGYSSAVARSYTGEVPYTERRPEWSAYLQDDFRVTSRLTLNLGLRWDLFVPWVEEDDRQSNFDPSTGRFVVASDDAVIAGVPVGRQLQEYSWTDFGPRFGFAYDVGGRGRTIVRGGMGVFWNWGPGGTSSSKGQNPPFIRAPSFTSSFGTHLTLSGGAPPIVEPNPDAPPAGNARAVSLVDARDAYALNWNVVVEQQLGRDYSVELAYVGSRGRQLTLKTDLNRAPPVLGVTNPDVNRPYIRESPLLRIVSAVDPSGTLDYHGLLVKLQRRFTNGLSWLTSYTWAKAIDLNSDNDGVVSLTDVRNPGYNRGPSDYDLAHTLSSAWTWELPLGRDSRLGGWQVNGILSWRTGLPVTVTQAGQMLSTGIPNNRPDRIGDGRAEDPTIEHWFDSSAFRQTADLTATFGTSGRNIVRGPGQFNIDLGLVKLTRFGKVTTELRVEAFNLLNHPQFAQPAATFGTPAFGTITAMLSNPACASCGTTERQVQLGLKLRF